MSPRGGASTPLGPSARDLSTALGSGRARWRTIALLVSSVLALGVLNSCASTEPGEVTQGRALELSGEEMTVRIPTGAMTFTVGEIIADDLAEDQTREGESEPRPGDGGFLPIAVSFDAFVDFPGKAVMAREPAQPEIAVVVDDVRSRLSSPYEVQGAGTVDTGVGVQYVALERASLDDVVLTVYYDGLTQTIDLTDSNVNAGAAAALYADATASEEFECPEPRVTTGQGTPRAVDLTCTAAVEFVPYLPGVGWAADGSEYPVVGYQLQLDSMRVRGTTYRPDSPPEVSFTVAGAGSLDEVAPGSSRAQASRVGSIEVFGAAEEHDVAEVEVRFAMDSAEGGLDARVSVAIPLDRG